MLSHGILDVIRGAATRVAAWPKKLEKNCGILKNGTCVMADAVRGREGCSLGDLWYGEQAARLIPTGPIPTGPIPTGHAADQPCPTLTIAGRRRTPLPPAGQAVPRA